MRMTIRVTPSEFHRRLSYLGTCWERGLASRYTLVVRDLGLQTFRLYRQHPNGGRVFLTTFRASSPDRIDLAAYRRSLAPGHQLVLRRAA